MDDTKKMLRAIINGQSSLRAEMTGRFDKLDKRIDGVEKNLTGRIDKIGGQLAYLEDDTPTRDEHEVLERRVTGIEGKIALAV